MPEKGAKVIGLQKDSALSLETEFCGNTRDNRPLKRSALPHLQNGMMRCFLPQTPPILNRIGGVCLKPFFTLCLLRLLLLCYA
jgi:hypothetical protein